ncbi:MAG: serine/threonine protein kinase [Roseibacillus sp.]|nr:serine/threonine protein kinase [Roseibacillus sp.]MBP36684.1 serine/threonine protein kinase [Roseibacillus sp.]MCP4728465.1 PQQ-binding-like beta-propeller repeat protein [Roseibacillus sp.]
MTAPSFFRFLFFLVVPLLAKAGDWPTWRGPNGNGQSDEQDAPAKWSATENVSWKVALPGPGNSSPIVAKGKVFVTQATEDGKRRALLCFDRRTGKKLWERATSFPGKEPTHKTNPYCAASPATDGKVIVVSHGSAGLVAYDFEGKEIWQRNDLGPQRHIWGNASSPLPYGKTFIQLWGPGPVVFILAVDSSTGETVWKHDLPEARGKDEKHWFGSWSTPVLRNNHGRDELLLGLPKKLVAFDPQTGKKIWWCNGLGDLVYNNAAITGDYVMATSGYGGPALGVKAGKDASGDITSQRLWVTTERNLQRIGTGAVVGDHYYILTEPGILQCIEIATGKIMKKARVGNGGNWGSITHVSGKLYVTNQGGQTLILSAKPDFEVLTTNPVNEMTRGSLAFSGQQAFLRTYKHLWCLGK